MNTQLRIDSLSLTNYRCFKKMDSPILFQPDITVLVARNGEGKTAFLDAVKIALGTFTSSFPVTTYAHFHVSDVHISALHDNVYCEAVYPVSLKAEGIINGKKEHWSRALQKAKGRTTTSGARVVSKYGEELFKKTEADDENANVSLPLIAFYGTGRLWAEHKDMDDGAISPLAQSRFAGYENALSARSTYKQVKNWLIEALQMDASQVPSSTQPGKFVHSQLVAIKKALQNVLGNEGLGQMHYNHFYKDIAVINNYKWDNGALRSNNNAATALPIPWLSDGIRAVFSMVADIAYRCVKLNPHLQERACEETSGIILIDEVDIFLHPSWQQRIIGDLQRTFPNIQFIVTTHSPQVVSSVPKECIRIIDHGEIIPFSTPTQGVEIDDILRGIFGTEPILQNTQIAQKLNRLHSMLTEGLGNTSEWENIYRELEEYYGAQYPPLLGAKEHRDFLNKMKSGGRDA